MTDAHEYFTVEPTALTIPTRGALAIYCGDAPRKNDDGSTSLPLRAPLLLMPQDMFRNPDQAMQKVAAALNAHAAEFFDSAQGATPADDLRAENERLREALQNAWVHMHAAGTAVRMMPKGTVWPADFIRATERTKAALSQNGGAS